MCFLPPYRIHIGKFLNRLLSFLLFKYCFYVPFLGMQLVSVENVLEKITADTAHLPCNALQVMKTDQKMAFLVLNGYSILIHVQVKLFVHSSENMFGFHSFFDVVYCSFSYASLRGLC